MPKAIMTMGNRILVVNQEGNVCATRHQGWGRPPLPAGRRQVCPGGEMPKAIMTMGNRILVVNQEGNVCAHDIAD